MARWLTTTISTNDVPEVYMSQAERARGRGSHYIEESVWVYLMRDWDGADRWVLDPVTVDGYGLDSGLENGVRNSECVCEDQAECDVSGIGWTGPPLCGGAGGAGRSRFRCSRSFLRISRP